MSNIKPESEIVLFKTNDGNIQVNVVFEDETVWLSQEQMAELFEKGRSTITEHIQNIFKDGELEEELVCREFRLTTIHGAIENKTQSKSVKHYNLDVIISVGYRVKSLKGTQFRQWATKRLREYLIKGFTMNDDRLKGIGGGDYWKELLDRIRDIRSSEKVIYRQVLDLYATSIDFDSKSEETILFFKIVQNKLHYAINKQTAAEIIYSRADAEKDFMGLKSFSGAIPTKKEVFIAKNYLEVEELSRLNRLVSAFFDLAELKAMDHVSMKMEDWVVELDRFTNTYGKGTLIDSGKISHEKAMQKAENEYIKYQSITLSPVEKSYLDTINSIQTKINSNKK